MAEKGDAPTDQVSLPPTYAPSETFTESPPPAYRLPGSAAVKIVKLVCMTVFFLTIFLCLFFLGYKYMHFQSMKHAHENQHNEEVSQLGETAPLVSKAGITTLDLNNNIIEEFVEAKEKQKAEQGQAEIKEETMVEDTVHEEEEPKNEIEEAEEQLLNEVQQDIPLPPLDLMLGKNPMMGPGNVKCKVQKKQKKIGEDIVTQAVIVKCDDEEEEGDDALKMRPLGPPLSILGNIMKALATKAVKARLEEPKIKKLELRPMPIPIYPPHHPEMMGMGGPFKPMPGPFGGPPKKIVHFIPLNKIAEPRPFDSSVDGPPPFLDRQRGPIPHFKKSFINFIPLKKFEEPRMEPFGESNDIPPPFFTPRREQEPSAPKGFLNFIPLRRIVEGPKPMQEHHEMPHPMPGPQIGPIPFIRPIKVIRQNLSPIQDPESSPPFPMEHQEGPIPAGPFPFPQRNKPVKIIRLIKKANEIEEFPEMMDGPFTPPNPIMKIIPRQGRRIIHVRREPINEELPFGPLRGGFPLPRGALPMEPIADGPHFNRLPMPQAKARAIPRPMALPGLKLLRIPFQPIPDMEPMPEEEEMSTHMEFRQPPQPFPFEGEQEEFPVEEEQGDFPYEEEPQILPEQDIMPHEHFQQEFGPPKTHTVIEAAPPPFLEGEPQDHHILPPPFMPEDPSRQPIHFPPSFPQPPPPPGYDVEGKFSPMAEVEPDAEMIQEEAPAVIPPQDFVPEIFEEERVQ